MGVIPPRILPLIMNWPRGTNLPSPYYMSSHLGSRKSFSSTPHPIILPETPCCLFSSSGFCSVTTNVECSGLYRPKCSFAHVMDPGCTRFANLFLEYYYNDNVFVETILVAFSVSQKLYKYVGRLLARFLRLYCWHEFDSMFARTSVIAIFCDLTDYSVFMAYCNCDHVFLSSDHMFLWSDHAAYLWSDHMFLWSDHACLWSDHMFLWSDHMLLWSDRVFLWSDHMFVWSDHMFLWSDHAYLWSDHMFLWSDHTFLWSDRVFLWSDHAFMWSDHVFLWSDHAFLHTCTWNVSIRLHIYSFVSPMLARDISNVVVMMLISALIRYYAILLLYHLYHRHYYHCLYYMIVYLYVIVWILYIWRDLFYKRIKFIFQMFILFIFSNECRLHVITHEAWGEQYSLSKAFCSILGLLYIIW